VQFGALPMNSSIYFPARQTITSDVYVLARKFVALQMARLLLLSWLVERRQPGDRRQPTTRWGRREHDSQSIEDEDTQALLRRFKDLLGQLLDVAQSMTATRHKP
jgi:hypothetical protein